MKRNFKPYLIDSLIHTSRSINGLYWIAKPMPYTGYFELVRKIYHSYLVFIGKATAIQFKEDLVNEGAKMSERQTKRMGFIN